MSSAGTPRPRRAERVGVALALFATAAWLCAVFEPTRLGFWADNQTFYFIAERVASGVPPHLALVNHKLALSMLISGGAIGLGRTLGIDDVLAARLVSIAFAAGTVSLVWALTLRLTRDRLAAIFAGVVMLTFSDFFKQAAMGVRPQLFAAFFVTLALVHAADRKTFRAGLFAGAAFLCWQPAATAAVGVAVAALVDPDDRRALWWVCFGGIVAFLSYEAYFLAHGLLSEQLRQSFAMGLDTSDHHAPRWKDALNFLLVRDEPGQGHGYLFALAFAVLLAVGCLRTLVSGGDAWSRIRSQPGIVASAVTAVLSVAFTFVDFQAFPDRFVLLPLYAAASGYVVAWLIAAFSRLPPQYIRTVIAAICIWSLVVPAMQKHPSRSDQAISLEKQRELAAKIGDLEREYGPVWAIGCVHLLGLARRDNFDRYGVLIDPRVRASMQRETTEGSGAYRPHGPDGQMPAVVLTSRHGARRALPWLKREYRPLEDPDFSRQRIVVWLRKKR